jgi:hypothetical protein
MYEKSGKNTEQRPPPGFRFRWLCGGNANTFSSGASKQRGIHQLCRWPSGQAGGCQAPNWSAVPGSGKLIGVMLGCLAAYGAPSAAVALWGGQGHLKVFQVGQASARLALPSILIDTLKKGLP